MINFLPSIIKTFSDNSQQSVGYLIKSIKADKSQVSELVKSLSNFSVGADFAPTLMRSRAIIESEFFVDIFRDVQIRFDRYFSASNLIFTKSVFPEYRCRLYFPSKPTRECQPILLVKIILR